MTRQQTEVAEKLARWANVGERDAPVAFVGRRSEIDLAIRQLATWRLGGARGRTLIAQGAPGAGKTALLHELGRRLPATLPDAASIYLPTPWADADIPSLLEALAIRMMGAAADTLHAATSTATAVGVKAAVTARHERSRIGSPPALTTWSAFERLFGSRTEDAKPTLLLVDEVQRMGDDGNTKRLLFNLHDQTTFPLVLVCGGLSTSAAHLGELGLARLDEAHVLRIDALTLAEARRSLEESLRIMADDVGGIAGHPDQWARRLAPPTHGWPQHITCHFRAAAEVLIESGRLAFDDDNLRLALARAEASMRRYYDRRLEASRTNPLIVHGIHEAIRQRPLRRLDAMSVIDAVYPLLGPYEREDHERKLPAAQRLRAAAAPCRGDRLRDHRHDLAAERSDSVHGQAHRQPAATQSARSDPPCAGATGGERRTCRAGTMMRRLVSPVPDKL